MRLFRQEVAWATGEHAERQLREFDEMCNILIVEDDAAIRSALVAALVDEGYQADALPTGTLALDRIDQGPVDLMLVDVHMPPLDGPEMVEIIRRQGNVTPVIMMSAQPRPFRKAPEGVRFIRKPFDLDRLFKVIEDLLAS